MTKKARRKRKQSSSRQFPWLWLATGGALLLIVGGLMMVWTPAETSSVVTPEVTGAPRLVIDQPVVDEGYLKFNTPVRTTFRLRNVGDQPLHILGEPQVELVEGC
jgi:hypothetical protein